MQVDMVGVWGIFVMMVWAWIVSSVIIDLNRRIKKLEGKK